ERLRQFIKAAVQVVSQGVDRQLAEFVDDGLQLFLQLVEAAGDGRDRHWASMLIEGYLGGARVEIQRDVQLAGQQVAGSRLRSQATLDEHLHQSSGVLFGIAAQSLGQFVVCGAQTVGVDQCADHHGKALGLFVIVELDRYHATDGYAEKLHRRIGVHAAQGLIKAHLHITRRAVGRRHGLAHVAERGELEVLLGELGVGAVIGSTQGDAAVQDRRDRFGVDGEAVGSNRDVAAAGVPEARVVGDELVIRGVYEDLHLDAFAVVCQAERNHLADLKAAKVHRRTNAQRAQIIGVEGELLAFGAKGHGRRCFQADKFAPGFLGASGVRTDEGPGQQRVYAGYTAGADARAYHPELGVFASEGLGVLIQLAGGDNEGSFRL